MCLTILKRNVNKTIADYIKIAEEDIAVYKWLIVKSYFFGLFKKYESPYKHFPYKLGKTYTVPEFGIEVDNGLQLSIGVGLHSYHQPFEPNYKKEACVLAIIPKGTEYIESGGEIVSKVLKLCKK